MTKQVRYRGSFLSRESVAWQVDIWQLSDTAFGTIGELTFPATEPVVIEWDEKGKEEVVCGSSATVCVESPGDRTYADLYTEIPGEIGVDIYREGALYWTGTLDPEQYEEPYERESKYDVTLCFQDFGILDRLRYDLTGMQTMGDILRDALDRAQLGDCELDVSSYVTSHHDAYHPATVDTMSVMSDNFYDEDGEPMTLLEVIEGMLQPLGQRMVQRRGCIWLYDLHGLAVVAPRRPLEWSGDSQTMGVDRVVNNIKLTFSPYADGSLLKEDELEYTDYVDENAINLTRRQASETGYWSFYPDYGNWGGFGDGDASGLSFTIHKGRGKGLAEIYKDTGYFRIVAQGDGADAEGVVWMFRTGGHGSLGSGLPQPVGMDPDLLGRIVMRTRRVYIPPINEREESRPGFGGSASAESEETRAASERFWLRLKMGVLADPRYNPFTEKSGDNESSNYDNAKVRVNYMYVPCDVRLWDAAEGGNVLYHYSNRSIAARNTHDMSYIYLGRTLGSWEAGDNNYHNSSKAACWLSWYDETAEDRREAAGIFGWQYNRQQIGADFGKLSHGLKNAENGQYMPYPPCGGWLEVAVWSSVSLIDDSSSLSRDGGVTALENSVGSNDYNNLSNLRWMLYKAPTLEVVSSSASHKIVNSDDIEHTAWVNPNAQEDLEIDTICGTMTHLVPTAKGIIMVNTTGLRLQQLTRAGRTDRPERLWMGTLYSQFATRHTKLTGEAFIDTGGLAAFTEANQDGRVFIMTGEAQNLIEDITEAVIVELSEDEYDVDIFEEI